MQTQELKLTIVDTQRFYMKMIHEYRHWYMKALKQELKVKTKNS